MGRQPKAKIICFVYYRVLCIIVRIIMKYAYYYDSIPLLCLFQNPNTSQHHSTKHALPDRHDPIQDGAATTAAVVTIRVGVGLIITTTHTRSRRCGGRSGRRATRTRHGSGRRTLRVVTNLGLNPVVIVADPRIDIEGLRLAVAVGKRVDPDLDVGPRQDNGGSRVCRRVQSW